MLIANVINKAVGMLSSMVITRLLTTSDYGVWSYSLNVFSYLSLITGLGLVAGALQFGTENNGNKKAYSYFKYCTVIGLFIDFIIVILTAVLFINIALPIPSAKPYVIAILPSLLIEYVLQIAQSILRSQNRIKEYARFLNFNSILMMIGVCVGAIFSINGVVVGRYIAEIVSLIVVLIYIKKDISETSKAKSLAKNEKKKLWEYSLFTGASSAMNCIVYYIDVTLIALLIKNETDIAFYKVATLIPNALQFIPVSVIVATLPSLIYHKDDLNWIKKTVRKMYIYLSICNVAICGVLMVFASFVITIVSGEKYLQSVPYFRVLLLGYFFSGTLRNLSVNILAAFRRVKFGLLLSVISCLLDIGLNYFLISICGSIGAAYATLGVDFVTGLMGAIYLFVLIRNNKLTLIINNN